MQDEVIVVGYQAYDSISSLIVGEIEIIEFNLNLKGIDCLIFTSKNAIRSLEENAIKYPSMRVWKKIPSYVIGEVSAKTVQKFGGKVEYISTSSYAQDFQNEIINLIMGKKCLYLRGEEIAFNLDQELLKQGIFLQSHIVYRNRCVKILEAQPPPNGSYLVFTAPSAYRFFLTHFTWNPTYRAVALGKTTFSVFDRHINKLLSPFQNIQKTIAFLKSQ